MNHEMYDENEKKMKGIGFLLVVLEGFSRKKMVKEEANHTEKQVQEVTGWSDLMEEKTSFVESAC